MATIQQTPEWIRARGQAGNHVLEHFIDIFGRAADGSDIDDAAAKPIDVAAIKSLYQKYASARYAYGVSTLTFTRPEHPIEIEGSSNIDPDAVWASISHAIVVFDLRHRRLAGMCFVPPAVPGQNVDHPLTMLIFAADKLKQAFEADLHTRHVISPVDSAAQLEFLPWLIYAVRDQEIRTAIRGCDASIPGEIRLTPEELLFWGLASTYDNPTGRTAVFPKSDRSPDQLLIGVEFALKIDAQPAHVNVRFCDSGAQRGHPPHLDIQVKAKHIPRIHKKKLVGHLPVDLSRFAEYGLRYFLLSYINARPWTPLDSLAGNESVAEQMGAHIAMLRHDDYRDAAARGLGLAPTELDQLVIQFNQVYGLDLPKSRQVEARINDAIARTWRAASTREQRRWVVEGAARLMRTRLLAARVENRKHSDEVYQEFLNVSEGALKEFERWISELNCGSR